MGLQTFSMYPARLANRWIRRLFRNLWTGGGHRELKISREEFNEVAAELGRTLDFFKVPACEKDEVLAAFAAHKDKVTAGYVAAP